MRATTDVNYTNRYFGFELGYDKTNTTATGGNFAASQYNGNITGFSVMSCKLMTTFLNFKYIYC